MNKDEAYQKEYAKWVASLSPQEQAELKAKGLDKPLVESTQTYKPDPDPVFAQMKIFDQLDEAQESDDDDVEELESSELIDMFTYVMSFVHTQLDIDAFRVALGLNKMTGANQTEIAATHGICRAAFSLHVKEWQRRLNTRPSEGMRSAEVCKIYSNTQKKIYERGERATTGNKQHRQVSNLVSKEDGVSSQEFEFNFEEPSDS